MFSDFLALVQGEIAHLRNQVAQRLRIARTRGMLFALAAASFVLAAGFGLFAAFIHLEARVGAVEAALVLGFGLFGVGLLSLVAALVVGQRAARGSAVAIGLGSRSQLTGKADVEVKVAPTGQIGVLQVLAIAFAVGLAAGRRAGRR